MATSAVPNLDWSSMTLEKMETQMASQLSRLLMAMISDYNVPPSWIARINDEGDSIVMRGTCSEKLIICDAHATGRFEGEVCHQCMPDRTSFLTAIAAHKLYDGYWTLPIENGNGSTDDFTFVSYTIPERFIEACKEILLAVIPLPGTLIDPNDLVSMHNDMILDETYVLTDDGMLRLRPKSDATTIPSLADGESIHPSHYYRVQPDDEPVLRAIIKLVELMESDMLKALPSNIFNIIDSLLLHYQLPAYAKYLGDKFVWKVLLAGVVDKIDLPRFYAADAGGLGLIWTNETTECQARIVISDKYIQFFLGTRSTFEGDQTLHPQPIRSFLRIKFGPVQMWDVVTSILKHLPNKNK
jgi:hypothetical protein